MKKHITEMTFGDLLNHTAHEKADCKALVYKDRVYTYKELKVISDALAKGLIATGIKKGDKIALWLNNIPEWAFFYYAIMKIGAVVVPVNTRFKTKDLEYILKQSESKMIIVGEKYRNANYFEILKETVPELSTSDSNELKSEKFPNLKSVVSVNFSDPNTISFNDLIEKGKTVSDEELQKFQSEVKYDDLCAIFYTSGTTGFPKGVMHSHKMIVNMYNVTERFFMTHEDNILLFLPLFHVYASQVGLTAACIKGATIVLMKSFEPAEALRLIEKERITIMYGFDAMYLDLMNHPEFKKSTLKSLRIGMCSGTKSTLEKVVKTCDFKVVNSYGLTEGTGVTSLTFLDDDIDTIISTNGYPMPNTSIRIVDPVTKEVLPQGSYGEICIKGPSVMLGYYKNPEETKKVLTEDGWLFTGDRGCINEAGYLCLAGRIKDIIRVGGENVDPVEVDTVLTSHPKIYRSCTVSAPDERLTEICVSFVQLHRGYTTVDEEELITFCKTKIASFKVPRHIFVVDKFPTTPTGKIQKFELQKMAIEWIEERKKVTKG